jgi:hypothetical protein
MHGHMSRRRLRGQRWKVCRYQTSRMLSVQSMRSPMPRDRNPSSRVILALIDLKVAHPKRVTYAPKIFLNFFDFIFLTFSPRILPCLLNVCVLSLVSCRLPATPTIVKTTVSPKNLRLSASFEDCHEPAVACLRFQTCNFLENLNVQWD